MPPKSQKKKQNKLKPRNQQSNSNALSLKQPSLGRTLLNSFGSLAGGYLGGPSGASIGTGISDNLATILGMGKYKIRSNTLQGNPVPKMHSQGESIIVRHREFVQDVVTSSTASTFSISSFSLNPGLSSSFPWLAGVAQNYTEYTWKGLCAEFVTTSGDSVGSTNTSLPSVMMATQYRSTSVPFTGKQTMLNHYYADDCVSSRNLIHCIECDPKENPYNVQYVRSGSVPAGEDGKTYDLGLFSIATTGSQGTSTNIGELWFTYEVELRKPVDNIELGTGINSFHQYNTTATTSHPFGTTGDSTVLYNNFGMTVSTGSNTIIFPPGTVGTYLTTIYYESCSAFSPGALTLVNCAGVNLWLNDGADIAYTSASTGAGGAVLICTTITDSDKQATIAFTSTITGATSVDITVTQVAQGFY